MKKLLVDQPACPCCGSQGPNWPNDPDAQEDIRLKWWHDPKSYRGHLIENRYQIRELGHGGSIFVIYDFETQLLIRGTEDRQVRYFPSEEACMEYMPALRKRVFKEGQVLRANPFKKAPEVTAEKTTKKPKVAKNAHVKKGTAAELFRELILANELDDDQIFAQVKEAFDLDDSKKGYVKWYRKDLTKKGLYPPK